MATYNSSNDDYPEWSPDGSTIAFVSGRYGNPEICSMDIASKAITRLTYDDSIDKHAQWSPDGQKVVFVTNRNGSDDLDVYVMKADGTGITCLVDWEGEETHPTWSSGHSSPPAYSVGDGAPDVATKNHFIDAYNRSGGVNVLGSPTTEVHEAWGYLVQDFPGVSGIPGGVIMYNDIRGAAYYIHGAIWERYYTFVDKSELGPVASDEEEAAILPQGTTGRYTKFETGTIHWISDKDDENVGHLQRGESFVTYGELDALYTSIGGTYSDLGFPVMDQEERDGHGYCEFEGGYIEWDGSEYKAFLKVQGSIQYFDGAKENLDGTVGGYLPLKYAKVEIDYDQNPMNGISDTISTDGNGNFKSKIQYNEEIESVYFRVYSDSYIVKVEDSTNGRYYYEISYTTDFLQSSHPVISINDANVNPIFNVYANVQKSYDTFSKGMSLPKVVVSLYDGSGGIYDPIRRCIYIDKQNYIDWLYIGYNSEVYHEYGHFVHLNKYFNPINDYPPNTDAPVYSKDAPNEIYGWIEGWAFFSPAVVNDNSFYFLQRTEYPLVGWYEVYTNLEEGHYQECKGNICSPTDFKYFSRNSMNLGRVAAFLWDVYDGKGGAIIDHYDQFDGKNDIRPILDVLNDNREYQLNYFNYSTNSWDIYNHKTPLTVKEFFDGWVYKNMPQQKEMRDLVKHHFSAKKGYVHIIGSSPIDLHLYNSLNEHIGLDENTGLIEREITGSYYSGVNSHPEEIFLIRGDGDENLDFIIKGTGEGTFTLTYESAANGKISKVLYQDINVRIDSVGYIVDNIYTECHILNMDYDGNGLIDQIILPTSITLSGEDLLNISFLPPIATTDKFNLTDGNTIPIKFTARDNDTGEFIYDTTANVTIINSTGSIITNFNTTNGIQIDSDLEQYAIDFNTINYPELTIGETYTIQVTFGDVNSLWGIAIAYFTIVDRTPPATITHPLPTAGTTYLNWTWTNPPDPDFNHTEIYLDGAFQTITSAEHYNATDLAPETSYTIGTRTVDTAGNINQTWMNDTATTLSAGDTIPPTIISVTLDAYTTIPDATIHVTVNATDNTGVTSVTADGASLAETGSIWEGDITAPSTTGDYTLTIRAEDAAGNAAEATADYSVVIPTGGLGTAILPKISSAPAGSTLPLDIKIVSTENFDDVLHVYLTLDGIPSDYQADIGWFNWTDTTVQAPAGGEIMLPIAVDIPGGTSSGYKSFGVKVESTMWSSDAQDYGAIMVT
jgi:hypothetical protein